MKFIVTLKDPDCLQNAIADAVEQEVTAMGLPEDEREAIEELRREKVRSICHEWFEGEEYLRVLVDTDLKKIRVLTTRELR